MIDVVSWVRRRRDWAGVAVLAALAYLPAFASAPGQVPADTKVYLYLDPGRLLADSLWSWDDRQFAGWVPHQTIGYLWPSGPWFWTAQRLGLPDWIAHRLWIGTILVAAGLGVRWCARRFGLAPMGALLAAVVYQLSPFALPYISRTSVLLLPFAGLGWLVGLTMSATKRGGWRDVALFALVIATVGGINATAMVMIAPAPILWILDAAARREITWRQAGITTLKLGGASIVVSLWWLIALSVQALFGAPVLNYTETLGSVTFTSVSTEALRGLGYWLFYVRDQAGPLTSMSLHYQVSTVVMAAGFLVILAGLVGLTVTNWRPRRFLTMSLLVGIVLAVGAHPIDDPSPLGRPLADSATSTLTLALRSSTRAVPLAILALALGAGALVGSVELVRPRLARVGAIAVAVLAFVNLPAIRNREFVDPVLAHPQEMPSAWTDVADELDRRPEGYRTFQLPGTESAVARWGQTVDPILPGLTRRSVVQRDWLPLGSAPAMDLFFALDDRFQTGTLEPTAIAPVARWFGADSIVFAGDVAFDRFRTARPERTWSVYEAQPAGLGPPVAYGAPAVNTPVIPMVDDLSLSDPRIGTPIPETALIEVESPQPVVTTRTGSTVVVGSGAGVVSAAGAGVLDGRELLRYAAALDDDELEQALGDAGHVVLTDSNRRQAHQWRGSQDALGHVEREDETPLRADAADHRLPVFADQTSADQTVAVTDGPVVATATSYGEAAALRPEDRPVMAIDGDPSTSWSVADRAEPIGERLRLDLGEARPVGAITVLQADAPGAGRRITQLEIRTDEGVRTVALDESSLSGGGQVIELGVTTGSIEFAIVGTDVARRDSYAGFGPVGLAEVRVDELGPSPDLLRLPTRGVPADADTPLTIVTERWRTEPTDRWRDDPERALLRRFELPTGRSFEAEVTTRLARRAPDDVFGSLLGLPDGVVVSSHLAGAPASAGWSALDGDPSTAWTTAFGAGTGASLTVPVASGSEIASLSGSFLVDDLHSTPTELTLTAGSEERRITLDPGSTSFTADFAPLVADTVTVQVTGVEDRFTLDRRFGDPISLPVAIVDVQIAGAPVVTWPERISSPCRDDLLTLDGRPVALRLVGATDDLLRGEPFDTEVCGSAISVASGSHDLTAVAGVSTGIDVDRIVLQSGEVPTIAPPPVTTVESSGRGHRRVQVGPCPDGCWLVTGDGWNTGWVARIGDSRLDDPEAVDGGFNGWYLPPGTGAVTVEITWSPQRRIWAGLALSVAAVLAALVVVARSRRSVAVVSLAAPRLEPPHLPIVSRPWVVPVAAGLIATLAIGPTWGLAAVGLSGAATLARRPGLLGVVGVAIVAGVGGLYVEHQRNGRYLPGFGWIVNIESTHRVTLLALVLVAAGALSERRVAERMARRR